MALTRRKQAASLGKMLTTLVRRLISRLSRSSPLVVRVSRRCALRSPGAVDGSTPSWRAAASIVRRCRGWDGGLMVLLDFLDSRTDWALLMENEITTLNNRGSN